MNNSVNEHSLIPAVVVYGMLPRLPDVQGTGPKPQTERLKMLKTARDEYAQIIAKRRIAMGIKARGPSSIDETFLKGEKVYVWREGPKKWTGPFPILRVEGKTFLSKWIQNLRSLLLLLASVTRVKKAFEETDVFWTSPDNSDVETWSYLNTHTLFWTEVLKKGDPRIDSPEIIIASREEIVNLIKRGLSKWSYYLMDTQKMSSQHAFVFALKHAETGDVKYKARFVLGGHRDKEKSRMVHTASTLSHSSVRLILALAAIFGFSVWSRTYDRHFYSRLQNLRETFCETRYAGT